MDHADIDHTGLTGVGGSVAADAIWDTAGDLAVGSGANTAAKLAKGNAGGVLAMGNSAVIWNAGTSFPASKATGDRYYRTDLTMEFFYDGTRWLSTQLGRTVMGGFHSQGTATQNVSGTTSPYDRIASPYLNGGSDIWLETLVCSFFVAGGGTALGASHKWVFALEKRQDASATSNSITSISIDSGSSSVFRRATASIGALLNNGTVHDAFQTVATKTGTPGNFEGYAEVTWRVVAT